MELNAYHTHINIFVAVICRLTYFWVWESQLGEPSKSFPGQNVAGPSSKVSLNIG